MNTVLRKHAVGCNFVHQTAKAVPRYPGRIFTSLKQGVNGISLILTLAAALLTSRTLRAQNPVFNCSCLSTQAVLFTNTCCGVIPNLCPVASNCYSSSVVPPPGYTCSQTPAPGTPVCSSTPINFVFTENGTSLSVTCVVAYYVGVTTNRFTLVCPPNQVVLCNATNWTFPTPTWTNTCCTNGVTVSLTSIVTNWPTITATWTGIDCNGVADTCSQSITFASSSGTPCKCLDIFCPSNIVVQTCLPPKSTAGAGTNILYPLPVVTNYCIGTITNILCSPPSGFPFPVGTNTVTCIVQDSLGNSAVCHFDVVVLGDTTPPVVTCAGNQTYQCGTTWLPIRPTAFDACCGSNVFITLANTVTNFSSQCQQSITYNWDIMDCNGNHTNCSDVISIVNTIPPTINCASNQVVQCGNSGLPGGGWQPTPPSASAACCSAAVTVSLVNAITNGSIPCNGTVTLTWKAVDCCSNTSFCTEMVTIIDTNPPTINCQGPKTVECGSGWTFDPPTAFDACCGTNVIITLLSNQTVFSSQCFSVYVRYWMATDCCSNSSFCSQRVTEVDTHPPNLICASNMTVNCGSPWSFTPPTAIDACCGTNVTISVVSTVTNAGTICPVVVTRTWQATDCCGNSTNCSQTVTIVDTVPPVITCASNQTVQCGTTWSLNRPTAIDACCGTNVGISIANAVTNGVAGCQMIVLTWKATDCCGNSSFCTNQVNVIDTIPPVITCRSNYVLQCGTAFIAPTATDNCCPNPTVTLLAIVTNSAAACNQVLTLTWQAQDCCTNTSTCTEVVNIVDTTPPVINCPTNKTVQCGSNWSFDTPTAFDACCTNVSLVIQGTFTNVFSTCLTIVTRKWQATDCCSNSALCSQVVTIVDTTPPTITCGPDLTVNFGQPWVFTKPSALDSCCGTNLTITIMLTTTNVGNCKVVYRRIWKATDCCGNSAVCQQKITVLYGPPINDLCLNAIPVTLNAPYICGTTICATPSTLGSLTPAPCGNSLNSPDVWYTVVAGCTGPMTVDTCAPCPGYPTYDTVLSAYVGGCSNLTQVSASACNDNACGLRSLITFNAMAGQTYWIRVSGASGAFGWFSIRAQQTSTTPPNDFCSNAIPVTVGSTCGSTICATPSVLGSIGTPCGNSVNTPDVWYTFTPQCNGLVTINTCGACIPCPICVANPQFDTVLSVYTGQCASLSQVGCNNNATNGPCNGSQQSQVTFNGVAGVTYYIRVSGAGAGTVGFFQLNISQNVITSPPNDLCANATPISAGAYAWNNCGANTDGPANACQPLHDVWFKFTAACAGPCWVNTCGSLIDTVLSVYSGSCANLNLIGCNDNAPVGSGPCGGSVQSFLSFNATSGQTYYIRVGSVGNVTGAGMLTLIGPNPPLPTCPPSGVCTNYRMFKITGFPNCIPWGWAITVPCCVNIQNTNNALICSGDPNTFAAAFVASVNAACGGVGVVATASPSPYPKWGRFVICTTCPGTNQFTLAVGAAGVPAQNLCVIPNTGGYDPVPIGYCSFNPDIEEIPLIDPDETPGCAPELTDQPVSQTVQLGDALSLSVSASGTSPLSYQWFRGNSPLNNSANISGATSSNLVVAAVTAADLGSYSVRVTNTCGSVQSLPVDISLAPATLPVLSDVNLTEGWLRFTVDTKVGFDYMVEYKNALSDPDWTPLVTVSGDGNSQLIYDSEPPAKMRFYRVKQVTTP